MIGSVQLDGSGYKELKADNGLAAVALSDDMLLWMTVTGRCETAPAAIWKNSPWYFEYFT